MESTSGQTRTAKSLFCWRSSLALPITSTSSALHADWKTNALHHQGYIAKWYVRTVCSHRHSSGGNGSCICMAPIVVNLFWALSICRWQCITCSAPCKFKTPKCWSFPGSAHQLRELLRCMGRREWSATTADWKVPRWKSRVATLGRSPIHTSLAWLTAVSGIHQALVDHCASSRLELFAGFCPILFLSLSLSLSLSPSHNTYLSLHFSFLHPFSFINVCVVHLLKVIKPVCNPLWWMQERVCGINFIFEIQVLCSIACWLKSLTAIESLHKLCFLNNDPLQWATLRNISKKTVCIIATAIRVSQLEVRMSLKVTST